MIDASPLIVLAEKALVPVVSDALKDAESTVFGYVGKMSRAIIDRSAAKFGIGFKDYVNKSYERCKTFRSLLTPDRPLEILDYYFNTSINYGNSKVEDTNLLQHLDTHKFMVITGLAGSGKSMLMKYITMKKFSDTKGAIPLFVELRHINKMKEKDLLKFIKNFCTSKESKITYRQFEISLMTGALMLILDGFDEIDHDFRDKIGEQLTNIVRDYPNSTVVVSSRPDLVFSSWQKFYICTMNKFSKKKSMEFVSRLNYDAGVKDRFIKNIDGGLYTTHESFLHYPLLVIIMLLTYEDFAEIPDKLHIFYSRAFDTLFQKHDAQKEQFTRKTYTGLSKEDFQSFFSVFCAISYLRNDFSFTEESALRISDEANNYNFKIGATKKKTDSNLLIRDLVGSICLLQQDGVELSFVHRSFQEYFTAVFIKNIHSFKMKNVLDKCACRHNDSVVSMAWDMDRETVEKEWCIPNLKAIKRLICSSKVVNSAEAFSKLVFRIKLSTNNKSVDTTFYLNSGRFRPVEIMAKLYKDNMGPLLFMQNFKIHNIVLEKLSVGENAGKKSYDDFLALYKYDIDKLIDIGSEDYWWLSEIGVDKAIKKFCCAIDERIIDIEERIKSGFDLIETLV